MKTKFAIAPSLALLLALGACGADDDDENKSSTPAEDIDKNNENKDSATEVEPRAFTVLVDLKDAEGKTLGTAELEEVEDGVNVHIKAEGLEPGKHGFHFHETGSCVVPDFESAGGHFNPDNKEHGLEMENGPHAGDMPNLEVGEDGEIDDKFVAKHISLSENGENSLLNDSGTALVIHARKDDGMTQPSGDSGDRIACGVIK